MGWRESRGPVTMSWTLMLSVTTAVPVKAPPWLKKAQVSRQTPTVRSWRSTVCCASTAVCSFMSCRTGGEQVDEQTAQEETEDKLKQCIDNLMDKRYVYSRFILKMSMWRLICVASPRSLCSAKTRLAGLVSLRQAFSSRVLYDFLSERRLTISDCLERCLKKGETFYSWLKTFEPDSKREIKPNKPVK